MTSGTRRRRTTIEATADDAGKISVLHAVAPGRVGGAETVVRSLARGHRERGHDARVAAVVERGGDHPFVASLQQAGVPVDVLEVRGRAYHREARRFARLLRRLRPDVVHTHGYRANTVAGQTARLLDVPVVSTVHGFTGGDWKNRLYEWLSRQSLRTFDAVIAVSRPLARELADGPLDANRVHVIPNATAGHVEPLPRAEARAELGLPGDGFVVGWVGRLDRVGGPKAVDVFLEAVAHLSDLSLLASVIGDGEARERAVAHARRVGVGDLVRWHGELPRAARLFGAFDCFVLSSRSEGTPMVVLEALAAEVPIVATRVGGVPDLLSAGEAELVEPEDPGALAAGVRRVHRAPEEAAARAERARERRESGERRDRWLDAHERVYRTCLR